jgi:uncharacterized protein (DUF1501 family)
MHRRQFLFGASALLTAFGLPTTGLAKAGPDGRKFLFVFNPGGWDPTRVFAPEFDNPNVDLEAIAQRATVGGLSYVDHPARPSVRNFFSAFGAQTLLFNGVMVRSIAHEICTMIMMTGSSSGLSPDWPTLIGDAARGQTTLPNLVLGGPSFPGDRGVAVARTGANGQLESLLSGRAFDASEQPVDGPSRPAESIVDRYLQRRAEARVLGARAAGEEALVREFRDSMAKLGGLKDLRYTMDFQSGGTLADQAEVAAQALSLGVSRTVCTTFSGGSQFGWDSHADNDNLQSALFEELFAGLVSLMATLRATPGTHGGTLADETTVVVLSEMGRTPKLNDLNGKDHWPYTSVMVVSPDVTGGRVVGGFDEAYFGKLVDPASGDVTDKGQVLSAEAVGATLLTLAGVDPEEHISGVAPITGVLS